MLGFWNVLEITYFFESVVFEIGMILIDFTLCQRNIPHDFLLIVLLWTFGLFVFSIRISLSLFVRDLTTELFLLDHLYPKHMARIIIIWDDLWTIVIHILIFFVVAFMLLYRWFLWHVHHRFLITLKALLNSHLKILQALRDYTFILSFGYWRFS